MAIGQHFLLTENSEVTASLGKQAQCQGNIYKATQLINKADSSYQPTFNWTNLKTVNLCA